MGDDEAPWQCTKEKKLGNVLVSLVPEEGERDSMYVSFCEEQLLVPAPDPVQVLAQVTALVPVSAACLVAFKHSPAAAVVLFISDETNGDRSRAVIRSRKGVNIYGGGHL